MTTAGFTDCADLASLYTPYDRIRLLTDLTFAIEYRQVETRVTMRWTATVQGFDTGGQCDLNCVPEVEARGNVRFMLQLEQLVTSAYDDVRRISKLRGGASW